MIDKSYLIAIGELGAAVAFRPDLMGELHFIYLGKASPLKELWFIGQAENGAQVEPPRPPRDKHG